MALYASNARMPRAHALDLADSLRAPRTIRPDAQRVGLDPLLRSQLDTMGNSIDGLLRRGELGREAGHDSSDQGHRVAAGARSWNQAKSVPSSPVASNISPRIRGYPPVDGALTPGGDGLLKRLLQGLQTDEVSVGDAIGTLESELHATQGASSPSRSVRIGPSEDMDPTMLRLECERCSVMGLQVRALAQSLAGLGARAFNWSAGLNIAQRRDLSELILEYARPCAHIDQSVEDLCKELSGAKFEDDFGTKMQANRAKDRESATWHWWDMDPEGNTEKTRSAQRGASPSSPLRKKEAPLGDSTFGGASPIPRANAAGSPGTPATKSTKAAPQVTVNIKTDGTAGAARIHLFLYDDPLTQETGEPGVLVGSEDVQFKKGEATRAVVMQPDLTQAQLGRTYHEMQYPGLYTGIDDEFGNFTYAEEPQDICDLDGVLNLSLIAKKPAKSDGFFNRSKGQKK